MLRFVDQVLDSITMYRLLRYYLLALLGIAIGLSIIGQLHFDPLTIAIEVAILVTACLAGNWLFGKLFDAPLNGDSGWLTALILALIITPDLSLVNIAFYIAASGLAMASKFVLVFNRKHIFNPAALAVAVTALAAGQHASWWVGSAAMLPYVLLGGVLIVRKVRRWLMVGSFLVSTSVATALLAYVNHLDVVTSLHNMFASSAVLFLGFVMLTEPQTSPLKRAHQVWYGALVGVLLPPQVHVLQFYTSPEISLLIGNIFTYIVSPWAKLFPALKEKVVVASHTVDFVFDPKVQFSYLPGQYMEWTLPHADPDSRGDRRYFTLASSPTEDTIRIGVKFFEQGSSYKRALAIADQNTRVVAAQVTGDFTLPEDATQKLAFIAGGIGITPFRSMIKYLLDTNQRRSAVLLYSARTQAEIAYRPLLEQARQRLSLKTVYFLTDEQAVTQKPYVYSGKSITPELIRHEIPDYRDRVFYISGTHAMVVAIRSELKTLGVPARQIRTDFFPGYV